MKYFLVNKQQVKENIWTNPILIRTKALSKIKKLRTLQKKLDTLRKQVEKDLYENNAGLNTERIDTFIEGSTNDEITRAEYNSLLVLNLLDTQEQRIKFCNKTNILKGNLFGNEIR